MASSTLARARGIDEQISLIFGDDVAARWRVASAVREAGGLWYVETGVASAIREAGGL